MDLIDFELENRLSELIKKEGKEIADGKIVVLPDYGHIHLYHLWKDENNYLMEDSGSCIPGSGCRSLRYVFQYRDKTAFDRVITNCIDEYDFADVHYLFEELSNVRDLIINISAKRLSELSLGDSHQFIDILTKQFAQVRNPKYGGKIYIYERR